MSRKKLPYIPTLGEEIANTLSHGVMACATLAALPFAAVWAYAHDTEPVLAAVSVSVFVISIFLMFLASTLYHSMNPQSRHKEVFHILDHIFIYVAIAGSYTPIALSVIGGWQGIVIAVVQWAMVLFGIFYKSLSRRSIPAVTLTSLPGHGVDRSSSSSRSSSATPRRPCSGSSPWAVCSIRAGPGSMPARDSATTTLCGTCSSTWRWPPTSPESSSSSIDAPAPAAGRAPPSAAAPTPRGWPA